MPLINPDALNAIQMITAVFKAGHESCHQTDLPQIQVPHCVAADRLEIVSPQLERWAKRISLRQQENGDFL